MENPELSMLEARAEIFNLLGIAPKELSAMVYDEVMEQCFEAGRQAVVADPSAGCKSVMEQLTQVTDKPAVTAKAPHKKQDMER